MSATSDLLDFAAAAHVLPAPARADTKRLLADTLLVGAAGSVAPGCSAIDGIADHASRAVGGGRRLGASKGGLTAASAAFVNGYRIHGLEWDAVHEPAVVHAMSVVTAALGAAIDRRGGCEAEEALVTLALGVDIAVGLGIAADSPLTFFRPATAGLIGATLAVSRLMRTPMGDALGIAYSFCGGTMQAHVEGSIALPLQIANAARAAILANDLAEQGFTGPHDVLEGQFGYFRLFDRGDLKRYTVDMGAVWRVSQISTKPFASGRASHAVLGLLSALELDPSEIASIEARVPPLVSRLVGRPMRPAMSPAYARLCLPFLAALILRDGQIDPRRFTKATFADGKLHALASLITVAEDGNADLNALSPQSVRIRFADGRVGEHAIPHTLGSPDTPLSASQADAKRHLATEIAGDPEDRRIFDDPLAYFTEPA